MNNNNQTNNNIFNKPQTSINISNSINTNTNSNVYNKEQVNTKTPVDNNKYKLEPGVPKKTILFLSLSVINVLMIVPFVIYFSFAWVIFGAFSSSESLYYGLLIGGAIYVILSVVILLREIFTALKYTSKKTNTFILMVIASIFGLFLFNRILPYAIPSMKSKQSKIYQAVKLKNNTLLETSDVEIKIDNSFTTVSELNINFKLNNKSNKYYNFDISKIRINGYDTDFKKEIINSNFATVGDYWVKPNDSSDNYNVYIQYDELKKHNISFNDIKKLSFDLVIYYDEENGKLTDSIQIPYNNFSVEVN